MKNIKLGSKVRDIVTGYTGIAVNRVEYLNGCIQYCVKPSVGKDGALPAGEYIDDQQLEILADGGISVPTKETGGPGEHPRGFGLSK